MEKTELTLQERILLFVEKRPDFVLVPSHRFLDEHDIPRYKEDEISDDDIHHAALCIVLSSQLGVDVCETDIVELDDNDKGSILHINIKVTGEDGWIPVKFSTKIKD